MPPKKSLPKPRGTFLISASIIPPIELLEF
jgi:hypothetical protein